MELRVLQYFLAVAREQNISAAAQSLHLTQPTLSRQLKELEEELGKQLMIRGNRKITLTEDGMLLRKRAEEILDLVGRTPSPMKPSAETFISAPAKPTGYGRLQEQPISSRSAIRAFSITSSAETPWTCVSGWTRGCWILGSFWVILIKQNTTTRNCP